MRVWELAEELRVTSADVLDLIEPYDRYVTSHLAVVPRQALDAIRAHRPAPSNNYGDFDPPRQTPPEHPTPRSQLIAMLAAAEPQPAKPDAPTRPPRSRRRRRPGPAPVTFEPPYEEDDDGDPYDTLDDLRYEPIWSTRDVARYLNITPATVRQWVTRGHLHPCGTHGPSHVFDRDAVLAAADTIAARTKRRSRPASPEPTLTPGRADPRTRRRVTAADKVLAVDVDLAGLGTLRLRRLAAVRPDSLLTTSQAAAAVGLAPSTIRSWVRRGHLTPSPGSTPRQLLFRLQAVYTAARRH